MSRSIRLVALLLGASICVVVAACGGDSPAPAASDAPLATGLELLPDRPELRRHVLLGDLDRLRAAYPDEAAYEDALAAVWLPDALAGARQPLWKDAFGLGLDSVGSYAAAGFHPAAVAVVHGVFALPAIRTALRREGYDLRGSVYERGADGEIDPSTPEGRLALAALNRIEVSADRLVAASTSRLLRAASAPSASLGARPELRAVASALDPVTSAIVLDASLVRPPSGVPTPILPSSSAQVVGVGIDDRGPGRRTLKIALVYDDAAKASADAETIARVLPTTALPGLEGASFSDLSGDWEVTASGRAILVTAELPPRTPSFVWRELVERGDLGPLVRPAPVSP